RANEATDKSTENSPEKSQEQIKDEDSIKLRKGKLSKENLHDGSSDKIFFALYLKISNAEKQNDEVRHELLRSYYYFGEELEKHLIQYKDLEEHEAQKKVNNEVKEQLLKDVSRPTIRKKNKKSSKDLWPFFSC
ncbi:13447_t:CDS:2, partial [Ambispora gerdemannii]